MIFTIPVRLHKHWLLKVKDRAVNNEYVKLTSHPTDECHSELDTLCLLK